MKKIRFIAAAIFLGAIFIFQTPVFAQSPAHTDTDQMMKDTNDTMAENEMKTDGMEEPSMMTENIDSFELFWPIVAGKTRGESWYFLKRLKEKVRGALIFGDAKDAEYNVFLAIKRVVEVEKLVNEDKHELASETLEDARENISEAREEWEDVEGEATETKHEINNKLNNLEKFLPQLVNKTSNDELRKGIEELLQDVSSLNERV